MPVLYTKIAAARNEGTVSYYGVRGLYFLAVISAETTFNPYRTKAFYAH